MSLPEGGVCSHQAKQNLEAYKDSICSIVFGKRLMASAANSRRLPEIMTIREVNYAPIQ
jgi:hypothetical protein